MHLTVTKSEKSFIRSISDTLDRLQEQLFILPGSISDCVQKAVQNTDWILLNNFSTCEFVIDRRRKSTIFKMNNAHRGVNRYRPEHNVSLNKLAVSGMQSTKIIAAEYDGGNSVIINAIQLVLPIIELLETQLIKLMSLIQEKENGNQKKPASGSAISKR